jgi:5-methylcytosine-specific restriction protein A
MIKRPCARPGCLALVQKGYCDACRPKHSARARVEAARPSAHKRGYTPEWSRYSRNRLTLHPLCEGLRLEIDGPVVITAHPGRDALATLTDHIVPHKGDQRLFWRLDNHQSGCDDCHNLKTAREDGGFGRKPQTRGGM